MKHDGRNLRTTSINPKQKAMSSYNLITQTLEKLQAEGKDIISLIDGNPLNQGLVFPHQILQKSFLQYTKNAYYDPDPKGYMPTREVISDYYQRWKWQLDPKKILLTSGTSEAYFYIFHFLANPGDNILAPNPSYPLFNYIADHAHIKLKPYYLIQENDWRLDLDQLQKSIDYRTRAIILIAPHNPTGYVPNQQEIEAIINLTAKKDIAIICDEVFREFIWNDNNELDTQSFLPIGSHPKANLVFTLNGISKMFALPWAKCGWIAVSGHSPVVDHAVFELETMIDTYLSTSTWIQTALPAIFQDGFSFLTEMQKKVTTRRKKMINLLADCPVLSFHKPIGGFYLTARINDPYTNKFDHDEEKLIIHLLKQAEIQIHPGYFYEMPENELHLVFSYLVQENRIQEGVERMLQFLLQ